MSIWAFNFFMWAAAFCMLVLAVTMIRDMFR